MNIQKFLDEYCTSRKLNGTIVVALGNSVIAKKNMGFADFSEKILCNENTQYQIGSITKQFTAAAVLKALYERVRKSPNSSELETITQVENLLQAPIVHFLPEKNVIWKNKMPAWVHDVTVHNLLQHSSGIPNYTASDYQKLFFDSSPNKSQIIEFFKDKDLDFIPGSMFSYSNSGYILLGAIFENIMENTLAEYLRVNIFAKIGMSNTTYPESGTVKELFKEHKYSNLALGYEFNVASDSPQIYEINKYLPMEVPGPAGAMIANARDLLKWNNALFTGKILSPGLLNLMLDSSIASDMECGSYSYGLESIDSAKLGKYYFHGGGIDGYKSMLAYIPKLDLSIICLTNLVCGGKEFWAGVDKINAGMPETLSSQEKDSQFKAALNAMFPLLAERRDTYNATLFYDALIEKLEEDQDLFS